MDQILSNPTLQPIIGALVAGVVLAIGTTFSFYKKFMAAKEARLEAETQLVIAQAEQARIAALAAVRIVEATGRPAIKVASDVKKDMAIAQAADLLGKKIDQMPEAIEEAHAAELRRSLSPEAVTEPEMPAAKRDAR
jgi:hypothetical protein